MATLFKFRCFLPPLLPHNLFLFTQQQQSQLQCDGLIHDHRHLPSRERSLVCACSVRMPRKKVKSNEELCNDIREFLCAVGLPEDHVPTTKELADNGRSDLANVVRRRGYKRIRELLVNSPSVDVDGSSEFQSFDKEGNSIHELACLGTGFRSSDNTQVPMESDDSKGLDVGNPSWTRMDLMADESLEEKVAKFIHTGDLDAVEDRVFSPTTAFSVNGKAPTSTSVTLIGVNQAIRNDDASTKSHTLSDLEKDFIVETDRKEKDIEINDLELMMQQKELELIRLQELIEKETRTLSDLQRNAETEITKAQNLLAEKDAELFAVESLTGLVQVTIQYHGDGQSVEVSGSFNGWHHKIVMDPKPSSDENIMESSKIMLDAEPSSSDENIAESSKIMTDPEPSSDKNITESRKSNIWSTTLWLYPGVYEIKFIVDGEWKTDDEMESVSQAGIYNNILRVARDD
ncbi:unnamed protein product [Linum trigynum]|uniref:AMP-activated protein kinase glycogen-binding domain-containing protein n=1 Tax=Linum trigynum TaxID=586398 RepID=A0AAV2E059_9ROSI